MELKGKKINVLGDSITEGCGTSAPEKKFTELLARSTGALVRNYGIGGTRIAAQLTPSAEPRFDRYFASRVDEMDPDADAVVVFGGTNDFGHGDAPLGKPDSRDPFTFNGALNLLCEELQTRYPAAVLVFLTPLHRCSEDDEINEFGIRNQTDLAGYCRLIREAAARYGIPFLDLFAVSGLQPKCEGIRERFMPDGLHPNDAGHEILARKLEAFLRQL